QRHDRGDARARALQTLSDQQHLRRWGRGQDPRHSGARREQQTHPRHPLPEGRDRAPRLQLQGEGRMRPAILLPALAAAHFAGVGAAAQTSAPSGAAPATTVPFGVGVVYNYVMHNLDRPQDWQFYTTVTSVSPDETLYTEEQTIFRGGAPHKILWKRRVSRREAANSKIIDNGVSCDPAD